MIPKRINNEKGFSLIELVMVIIILGILAAVVAPKLINLEADSKLAFAKGLTGIFKSQITMLHSQYLLSGTTYDANTVIGSIDTIGITRIGFDWGVIFVKLDDSTFCWMYTDHGAILAAEIEEKFNHCDF